MNHDNYSAHVIANIVRMINEARRNAAGVAKEDKDDPLLTYFAGLADGLETALESLQQLIPNNQEQPTLN